MNNLKLLASKAITKCKVHSPEILLGVGIVSLVGAGVLACRASFKAQDILDQHQENLEKVKKAREVASEEEYTDRDYKKDLTMCYGKTCMAFAKLYGPAVTLAIGGVISILAGYNIIHKRNVAIVAAYNALEKSFGDYRKRVVDQLGLDQDRYFKTGIKEEMIEETITDPDTGKEKKTKSKQLVMEDSDPSNISVYARIFDDGCIGWKKDPEMNLVFLRNQESYFNDLLRINGYVLLNDVYQALGFPRTQAGAVVGWVLGNGDGYIDFGIYDVRNRKARDFVNGYERNILLDFNVDGVIYDKI